MTDKKYAIIRTRTLLREPSGIGVSKMARLCAVHPDLIDRLVRLGLLEPLNQEDNKAHWRFHEDTVRLVAKIMRLRNQLGINYAGIGVVLDLLSRIERLESRLLELENLQVRELDF
ncbi:MAG: chaperone modulator CbpM [Desulfatiglandaceae bacterium]